MLRILTLLLLLMLTACTMRMAAFAPRRSDIPEHSTLSRDACLSCHEVAEQRDHKPTDDCLHCHHLVKGI